MAKLIGETKTRFYYGNTYKFVRVSTGLWNCTSHEFWQIPETIVDEIEREWK